MSLPPGVIVVIDDDLNQHKFVRREVAGRREIISFTDRLEAETWIDSLPEHPIEVAVFLVDGDLGIDRYTNDGNAIVRRIRSTKGYKDAHIWGISGGGDLIGANRNPGKPDYRTTLRDVLAAES